jgi:hypothetical protein
VCGKGRRFRDILFHERGEEILQPLLANSGKGCPENPGSSIEMESRRAVELPFVAETCLSIHRIPQISFCLSVFEMARPSGEDQSLEIDSWPIKICRLSSFAEIRSQERGIEAISKSQLTIKGFARDWLMFCGIRVLKSFNKQICSFVFV